MRAFLLILTSTLLLLACSSPASRIKKNPELFASFPPEHQALIQEGRIAIGFTPEAVEMALGPANRVYTRETSDSQSEVWSYSRIEYRSRPQYTTVNVGGRVTTARVDVDESREVEVLRVEFVRGQVSSIEQMQ